MLKLVRCRNMCRAKVHYPWYIVQQVLKSSKKGWRVSVLTDELFHHSDWGVVAPKFGTTGTLVTFVTQQEWTEWEPGAYIKHFPSKLQREWKSNHCDTHHFDSLPLVGFWIHETFVDRVFTSPLQMCADDGFLWDTGINMTDFCLLPRGRQITGALLSVRQENQEILTTAHSQLMFSL